MEILFLFSLLSVSCIANLVSFGLLLMKGREVEVLTAEVKHLREWKDGGNGPQ